MTSETRFTLTLVALVVATAAVGLGVFLYFGSEVGIYTLGVGIPVVILLGTMSYVRSVRTTSSGSSKHYFETTARSIGDDVRTLLGQFETLREKYPDWDDSTVDTEFEHVLDELADAGLVVDRENQSYDVTSRGGQVHELERLDGRLRDVREEFTVSVRRFTETREARARDALEQLEAEEITGADSETDLMTQLSDPTAETVSDGVETLESYDRVVSDAIDETADHLHTLAAETGADESVVDRGVDEARHHNQKGRYGRAVDELVATRDELEGELAAPFDRRRDNLDDFLDTVESSIADEYVSPRLLDEIDSVRGRLADLESALDVTQLDPIEAEVREASLEIVAEMETDLEADLETLATAEIPEAERPEQSMADTETGYVRTIEDTDGLDAFRREWLTAVGEIATELDAVSDRAAAASAYPDISTRIDDEIRTTGRVEADALPVKQPALFMEWYAMDHDAVDYEPVTPALVQEDFGETYTVTVQAGFAEGGPKRDLEIEFTGTGYAETTTTRTHLLEVFEFEDVPRGEYELAVTTDESDYETVTRDLVVSGDEDIEVTLEEVELHEIVCAGIEEEAQDALADASMLFEDRFDEEEYLSDEQSFPLSEEFLSCLLVLWAREQGLTAVSDDGSLLVYDGEQFRSRLENIVQYNLEAGEWIAFDEIRARYLAVPASDELIRETLAEIPSTDSVEIDDDELTKN